MGLDNCITCYAEIFKNSGVVLKADSEMCEILRSEYEHFNSFIKNCDDEKSVSVYEIESAERADKVLYLLKKRIRGVKKVYFEGFYEDTKLRLLIDETNSLDSEIELELVTAYVSLIGAKAMLVSNPEFYHP